MRDEGHRGLEVFRLGAGLDDERHVIIREPVLGLKAGPLGVGQLWHAGADLVDPLAADGEGGQVRLREVAVVVGVLLAALRDGLAAVLAPAAGLLDDAASGVQHLDLAVHLVLDAVVDVAEAVDVLELYLNSELWLGEGADADVRLAAHVPFFHVGAAGADVAEDLAELDQVGPGLLRGPHVRLRHYLHEGYAGAVDIDQAVGLASGVRDVCELGGVLLQMDAGDADPLRLAVYVDLQPTVAAEGEVILRDLVAFHQVRVVVVLAVELGLFRDLTVEGQAGHDGHLYRPLVDDGQDTGHGQADRTDVAVGGRVQRWEGA